MNHSGHDIALHALTGLLDEFRRGHIVAEAFERSAFERHGQALYERWDGRFPGFPQQYFPFTSLRGEHYRGKRDAYLKNLIVERLKRHEAADPVLVNPACVFGRHARDLALRLDRCRVIATDIDRTWNGLYERFGHLPTPDNFEFVKANIFAPNLDLAPTAVVFFGACGAVSDGCIDYAIENDAALVMCRTCCHDNIGGNTKIVKRPSAVNRFFRFKNWCFERMRTKKKYDGFYFSDRYTPASYPRSANTRMVSNSDEFQAVSRNACDSDVCRAIIDLDRSLWLMERGYNVWCRGELFVAELDGAGEAADRAAMRS